MGGVFKKLFIVLAAIVGLFIAAAILLVIFFDPNDYRDQIADEVRRETGRELVIEGDLGLTFFPWFAVNIGKTTLGNAPGFGDEPFLAFDEAQLSIGIMPLIRGDGLRIGSVVLDSFQLNLAVDKNGRNNWDDMAEHSAAEHEKAPEAEVPEGADEASAEQEVEFSIASIDITDAAVRYDDARAGEKYSLTDFNLVTGRIGGGDPIDVRSSFNFEVQPSNLAGDVSIKTSIVPAEGGVTLGDTEISAIGIAATLTGLDEGDSFHLQVDAFSLKSLMERLNMEAPVTADPDALGKIMLEGDVKLGGEAIALSGLKLVVDDTTFTGGLSVARNAAGTISLDLAGNSMDLDRYMEPAADPESTSGDAVPVEIPVDLIRALNVRGKMTLDAARLSGLEFRKVTLGLNAAQGNLRLHPVSAGLFGGQYSGDVRINASGKVPALSVDESITGVDLNQLSRAMFDEAHVTGTINGSFKLNGSGADLGAIQRGLNGNISMELLDGAWQGTDVWYQLRRARAMYKKETPPEPTLPAQTKFSNVKASGPVVDGVFKNDVVSAELPFMRLAGKGQVDIPAGKVDYRLTASFLKKAALEATATEEELQDFSGAEIPLKITGPLTGPTIAPDIEEMLKKEVQRQVEKEVKDKLLKKLLGDDE